MENKGIAIRMSQEELMNKYPTYDAGCRVGNARVLVRYKKGMTQQEHDEVKDNIKQVYIKAMKSGVYKFSEEEKEAAKKRAEERKNCYSPK